MAIHQRIVEIKRLLERLGDYNSLVLANNFEAGTIDDMKGNTEAICEQVKSEIDNIISEISDWE